MTETPLKIAAEFNIKTAKKLHQELSGYADLGCDLALDLSEVRECDTAALQLIYSSRKTATQNQQQFQISAVSPEIEAAAAALGLQIASLSDTSYGI